MPEGLGSMPSLGTKILQAAWPKEKGKKGGGAGGGNMELHLLVPL